MRFISWTLSCWGHLPGLTSPPPRPLSPPRPAPPHPGESRASANPPPPHPKGQLTEPPNPGRSQATSPLTHWPPSTLLRWLETQAPFRPPPPSSERPAAPRPPALPQHPVGTCPALLPSLGTGTLFHHCSAAPLTCPIFAASFAHLRTCPCLPDLHPPLTSQLGCAFSAVSREPPRSCCSITPPSLLFFHTSCCSRTLCLLVCLTLSL